MASNPGTDSGISLYDEEGALNSPWWRALGAASKTYNTTDTIQKQLASNPLRTASYLMSEQQSGQQTIYNNNEGKFNSHTSNQALQSVDPNQITASWYQRLNRWQNMDTETMVAQKK